MAQQLEQRAVTLATQDELTVEEVVAQVQKVQELMRLVMHENEHYGVIPGTDKPTLLKPGAEKLCLTFRLAPDYEIETVEQSDLVSVTAKCILTKISTGEVWGAGVGSCNSREKKYRYMWVPADPPTQEEQDALKEKGTAGWRKVKGKWVWHVREENDNAYEYSNTITKMACKRALVAAVLNATAASDIFTQDMEDMERVDRRTVVPVADEETIQFLLGLADALAERASDIWGREVLLRNIQQRFGVESFADLTKEQAQQVIDGAAAWNAANPEDLTPEEDNTAEEDDGDVVAAADVEVVNDEPDAGSGDGDQEAS